MLGKLLIDAVATVYHQHQNYTLYSYVVQAKKDTIYDHTKEEHSAYALYHLHHAHVMSRI